MHGLWWFRGEGGGGSGAARKQPPPTWQAARQSIAIAPLLSVMQTQHWPSTASTSPDCIYSFRLHLFLSTTQPSSTKSPIYASTFDLHLPSFSPFIPLHPAQLHPRFLCSNMHIHNFQFIHLTVPSLIPCSSFLISCFLPPFQTFATPLCICIAISKANGIWT